MPKKQVKLKGKAIANRLTGISTPIGGISWTPPVNEKDKAKQLLVFLEDRRVIYHPYDIEVSANVVKSIINCSCSSSTIQSNFQIFDYIL